MNKMGLSCDVIQDLCLLYPDNLCSLDSRELIQEHISQCEICRRKLDVIEADLGIKRDSLKNNPVPLQENQSSRRSWILLLFISVFLVSVVFVFINKEAVFQEGNPVNYGKAFAKLAISEKYVDISGLNQIGVANTRYLTKRDDSQELFTYIEQLYHVKFEKKLDNGYRFSDGNTSYLITKEAYLKFFTVWDIGKLQ